MKFTKMEGCGNDYIYINCFEETVTNPQQLAITMSERHFGVGADGIVMIMPSEEADFRMRMFNADGSEGEMCGNASRCVGKFVYDKGLTNKTNISLSTLAGIKYLQLHIKNGIVDTVTVDMGEPIFEGKKIPTMSDREFVQKEVLSANDKTFEMTCVSMGNPHAVTYVENTDNFNVQKYGSVLESNPFFPNKANIEFVQIIDDTHLKMRVWERGSGETMACGTGACATVVATAKNGICKREADVILLGGTLHIQWNEQNNHIYMTGEARFCFDGVWLK
ncbi:diaminopimelate epimerase [Clostridium sp. MD294]|uniref:diaminopimelate epimerase n=1 Tax=Clostridium sp. MD294 TaxID=97138 RepID=UPI0002CBE4DD|nr:diaminopimelate epimerase [Clostridium sp. MD294]NDO45786.1 diaminopimelate epimerase [Clostridium sp. MD294]USF30559.1 Diaminopimelate epimerase [Clostridium sp. MD294]